MRWSVCRGLGAGESPASILRRISQLGRLPSPVTVDRMPGTSRSAVVQAARLTNEIRPKEQCLALCASTASRSDAPSGLAFMDKKTRAPAADERAAARKYLLVSRTFVRSHVDPGRVTTEMQSISKGLVQLIISWPMQTSPAALLSSTKRSAVIEAPRASCQLRCLAFLWTAFLNALPIRPSPSSSALVDR